MFLLPFISPYFSFYTFLSMISSLLRFNVKLLTLQSKERETGL